MALRRRHIDLDRRTVRVEATVSEVARKLTIGPPKSAASEHLRGKGSGRRVFVGANGPTVRRSNWHTVWKPACEKAGVEGLHFHDLRHIGNTLAAATGASLRELMIRIGTPQLVPR